MATSLCGRRASLRTAVGMAVVLTLLTAAGTAQGDSEYLYGIHWWGYGPGDPLDTNPATMLDCPSHGGWDVETVLTHSASWWAPSYFPPLYAALHGSQNMTIITRIDYDWRKTVPAPAGPDYATWPSAVVNAVNTLSNYCHIWIIGNEPNILEEGTNWPDSKITPAGYATIYRNVRDAIHNSATPSPLGEHIVLTAAPSPGGIIAGVRWMDGNQWLGEVLDNVPNSEIDGIGMHAYGGSVSNFHSSYVSQLSLVDSKGLQDRPVYITEWNKYSAEADMAQFVRDAYADLAAWNQTPGNHNIRCLCWFIYDADQQAGGQWDHRAIEHYRDNGVPLGDPSNLYTAFQETVDLRYPAGLVGTRSFDPVIDCTPDSFVRQIYESRVPPDDTFEITNIGGGTINYNITDDASWLSVNPASGSSSGESDTITISYSTATLPEGGPYQATISVSAPEAVNSPETVAVTMTVLDWPYPADLDRDEDVDQNDFGLFQACVTGTNLGPPPPGCDDADMDEDNDVDQADFGLFQRCLSGSGFLPDPDCAAD